MIVSKHRLLLALAPLALLAGPGEPTPAPGPVPLTLAEAVARARDANPATLMAAARIDAAEALATQAAASGLPSVYAVGAYDATNQGGAAFGHILNQRAFSPSIDFNRVGTQDNAAIGLGARYNLYDGGRTKAARRAAAAGTAAERRRAEGVEIDLATRAAELWYAIVAGDRLIDAARAQADTLDGAVRRARDRVDAGTLLNADRLLLEVRLARAREQLVNAEAARRIAARALLTLLDRPGDTVAPVLGSDAAAPPDPDARATDPGAHPVVAAMRERVSAAGAAEDAAASGRSPRVMMQGEYGYNHGFRSGEGAAGFAAGIRVEYDLFDGDLTSGRVREARAHRREAEAALHAAELEVARAADEAKTAVERARAALRVTEHAVAAAEEHARVTRTRFESGAATAQQVADAEAALVETRANRIFAETAERTAVIRRRAALGLNPLPDAQAAQPRTRP